MSDQFKIKWLDSGREPQCDPNPAHPDGVKILSAHHGEQDFRLCLAELPYPAKRCGMYVVECTICGARLGVTTAGRFDDPRSVEMECQPPHGNH